MPIHDWSRVHACVFHNLHLGWITELGRAFNNGVLPSDYYCLGEQLGSRLGPEVLTQVATPLKENPAVVDRLGEPERYARRQRTLVIRHAPDHRMVALFEILSPGNKTSRHELRLLLKKAHAALSRGIHLLLIDLQPSSAHAPQGIHGALWEQLTGEAYVQPPDKLLTLAAYDAGPPKVAYVEPLAVGDVLPVMPLFLAPEHYMSAPLESTYLAAYNGMPRYYRNILERPDTIP
jgi:hypothetical protein